MIIATKKHNHILPAGSPPKSFLPTNRFAKKRGFTLIELLLGLSIFAVIAVLVYSVFAQGIRLSARSEKDHQLYREIYWTFDQLSRDLGNMVNYNFANSYPELMAFEGQADRFSLLIASDDGLKRIVYELIEPESSHIHRIIIGETHKKNISRTFTQSSAARKNYLVRKQTDFLDYLNGQEEDAEEEVIAMNVKENGLKISYAFKNVGGGEDVIYKEKWGLGDLPQRIRVEINFASDQYEDGYAAFTKEIYNPAGKYGETEG